MSEENYAIRESRRLIYRTCMIVVDNRNPLIDGLLCWCFEAPITRMWKQFREFGELDDLFDSEKGIGQPHDRLRKK